jgi:hypothetical protein
MINNKQKARGMLLRRYIVTLAILYRMIQTLGRIGQDFQRKTMESSEISLYLYFES